MSFVFAFSIAIAMAVQISVGHLIGQGKKEEALHFINLRSKKSSYFIFAIAIFIAFFSKNIISLLTKDQMILDIVPKLCYISVFLEPLRYINCTHIFALTSGGDVKYPVMVGLVVIYLINIPLSYLVVITLKMELVGLFCCAIFDELIRSTLFRIRWNKKGWMKLDVTSGIS